MARCVLEIFEDYFDIDFPLEQLNLVAIPDFQAGAMENWGETIRARARSVVSPPHRRHKASSRFA